MVCAPGTPNCAANGFLSGYDEAGSYNLATGLGSNDISSLVNNWMSIGKTNDDLSDYESGDFPAWHARCDRDRREPFVGDGRRSD